MSAARHAIRWRCAGAAWVLAAALLVPQAATIRKVLDIDARIEGSESARVDSLLAGPLASRQARTAVLVVSHDRYFLNRVCTDVLAFEGDGRIHHSVGDYDYYFLNFARRRQL